MNFQSLGLRAQFSCTAALFAGVCLAVSLSAATAQTQPQPSKWGPHIDLEGKWGNRRSLGDIGLFAPLWQSPTSLFFTDIRGRLDDQNSREGNFGFGLRHMQTNGWNAGIYGYYDARRTGSGNLFHQATLGAELLSADFDLRVNGYLPFGRREYQIGGGAGGAPFAQLAGGTIQVVTPGGALVERSLRGLDGEIGWRLPVFPVDSLTQIRAYAGGFWFDGEGLIRDIAGPRGRIELSFEKAEGPFAGSRFTIGAEVQHDRVRGTNAFAVARLRIPLQPAERPLPKLTPQERRMTERVVRDVDIVAGQGVKGSGTPTVEAAVNVYSDETISSAAQVDAAGGEAALLAAVAGGGVGSVIIANGAFTVTGAVQLGTNQALIGGGAQLPVRGAITNTQVTFTAPGATASLTGSVAGGGIVTASAGSSIGGLSVVNSGNGNAYGVLASNDSGVTIFANAIETTSAIAGNNFGIYFSGISDNGRALGNTITTAGNGSTGIYVGGAGGVAAIGNTITTTTPNSHGIRFDNANNGSALSNTISSAGGFGVLSQSSNNVSVIGNSIQSGGAGSAGLYVQDSSGLTVANNTFGPSIIGTLIDANTNSSFVTADSTGNIDLSAGALRCDGDGTATGTVSFTTGPNCVFP